MVSIISAYKFLVSDNWYLISDQIYHRRGFVMVSVS